MPTIIRDKITLDILYIIDLLRYNGIIINNLPIYFGDISRKRLYKLFKSLQNIIKIHNINMTPLMLKSPGLPVIPLSKIENEINTNIKNNKTRNVTLVDNKIDTKNTYIENVQKILETNSVDDNIKKLENINKRFSY
jgi:hypothetical protein